MREIKFRGKRVDNGEWVYGFLITTHTKIGDVISPNPQVLIVPPLVKQYMSEQSIKWDILELDHENIHAVIPETVGQFTGLPDKNGAEIYAGDVVQRRTNGLGVPAIIVWSGEAGENWADCGFCLEEQFIPKVLTPIACLGSKAQYDFRRLYEVIGNIHDNPELLEGHNGEAQ